MNSQFGQRERNRDVEGKISALVSRSFGISCAKVWIHAWCPPLWVGLLLPTLRTPSSATCFVLMTAIRTLGGQPRSHTGFVNASGKSCFLSLSSTQAFLPLMRTEIRRNGSMWIPYQSNLQKGKLSGSFRPGQLAQTLHFHREKSETQRRGNDMPKISELFSRSSTTKIPVFPNS